MSKISIIGTVGVPAGYGGFETLAENLVKYHESLGLTCQLEVYCEAGAYPERKERYLSARLRYVPLRANGIASIVYDIWSLFAASWRGSDVVLVLGVSGAIGLPLIRAFSSIKIVTNIDGIEWRREKWSTLARWVLKFSEALAIQYSHVTIADNEAIADYVTETYSKLSIVIPYGGDHALATSAAPAISNQLPDKYAMALCRIEPENNVAMILEAFERSEMPLVFVGNWDKSHYGRTLKAKYTDHPKIVIHAPVYGAGRLRDLRDRAVMYIHGHSAGGTNPALVEMMHFKKPVFAYDCAFNRFTTEGKAYYFSSATELTRRVEGMSLDDADRIGTDMHEIACRRYTWAGVGEAYFRVMQG